MSFTRPKTPITKANIQPQENDYVIDLSYFLGPDITHMSPQQRWETLSKESTDERIPGWAADKAYMMETVREIVEKYKLYDALYYKAITLYLVLRDAETWGLHSGIPSGLPDLGPKGFRLRIDHFLSHNLDNEDAGWGMVLKDLRENHPWQGVLHEDRVPFLVTQVRKHLNANGLDKNIRSNMAMFLAIKDTPDKKMRHNKEFRGPGVVYIPESFWQLEFINKQFIIENPLEEFHKG